jgi:L-cysteine:1D-myo-inositol 2-amino-2-deoxy-alpha-D-glucopyranoside ligase
MVAYQGEKMSKSLGNLVLVSQLRERGVDPRAVRLAILAHHYRSDWEWTDEVLGEASARVDRWTAAFASRSAVAGRETRTDASSADVLIDRVRDALRNDLDTPTAISLLDDGAASGVDDGSRVAAAVDALLGVDLTAR